MSDPTHYKHRTTGAIVSVDRMAWREVMRVKGLTSRKQLRKLRKAETKARLAKCNRCTTPDTCKQAGCARVSGSTLEAA